MSNWKLYLDESGNTGTNFTDHDQPIFIYGGWLLQCKNIANAENYINNCFIRSKAKELKYKNIIRRYKKDLYSFINGAIENEMYPFFIAMDKTHILLAHIVEMFFDYAYNPNVNIETTFDFSYKKELVDKLYGNENLIDLIAVSIRNGTLDITSLRELKKVLSEHLLQNNMMKEYSAINGISDNELNNIAEEYKTIFNDSENIKLSPITSGIFTIMINVDKLATICKESVDIIRDELHSKKTFEDISMIVENRILFPTINSIDEEESEHSILLQAADLLCGFVAAVLNGKIKDDEVFDIWKKFYCYQKIFESINIFPILYMMKKNDLIIPD